MSRVVTFLAGILALFAVLLLSNDEALGKADTFEGRKVNNIQAIITHVDTSDNAGDADWNIVIRPPIPIERALAGPLSNADKTTSVDFWRQMSRSRPWLNYVNGKLGPMNGWSQQCQSCAGTSIEACKTELKCKSGLGSGVQMIEEAACNLGLLGERTGPGDGPACSQVFACASCLHDMRRLAYGDSDDPSGRGDVDGLSNFTPKAEIFFGTDSQDMNDNLCGAMFHLGLGGSYQNCSNEGEHNICDELFWNGQSWVKNEDPLSPCGKRVLVSGSITQENVHDYRPEIHPVSSMVVEHGPGYGAGGVFIDGSRDAAIGTVKEAATLGASPDHTINYRETFRELGWSISNTDDPNQFILDYSPFQPTRPASQGVRPGSNTATISVSSCDLKPIYDYNKTSGPTMLADPPIGQGGVPLCKKFGVGLNEGAENGAAFVAGWRAGWSTVPIKFLADRARLLAKGGILSTTAPQWEPSKWQANGSCQVPNSLRTCKRRGAKGTSICPAASSLKRWFPFEAKVVTDLTQAGAAAGGAFRLSFSREAGKTLEPPFPTLTSVRTDRIAESAASVWLPATDRSYEGAALATLTYGGDNVGTVGSRLYAGERPGIRLTTKSATRATPSGKLPVYSATVRTTAERLCSEADNKTYRIIKTKDGQVTRQVRGTREFTVDLESGKAETISVAAQDRWGFQHARQTLEIRAPYLAGQRGWRSCDDWRGALPAAGCGEHRCRSTTFAQEIKEVPDKRIKFPAYTGKITYGWKDVRILLASQVQPGQPFPEEWPTTPPSGWTVTKNENKITVAIPRNVDPIPTYYIQAALVGRDTLGREAASGFRQNNDFTVWKDIRKCFGEENIKLQALADRITALFKGKPIIRGVNPGDVIRPIDVSINPVLGRLSGLRAVYSKDALSGRAVRSGLGGADRLGQILGGVRAEANRNFARASRAPYTDLQLGRFNRPSSKGTATGTGLSRRAEFRANTKAFEAIMAKDPDFGHFMTRPGVLQMIQGKKPGEGVNIKSFNPAGGTRRP